MFGGLSTQLEISATRSIGKLVAVNGPYGDDIPGVTRHPQLFRGLRSDVFQQRFDSEKSVTVRLCLTSTVVSLQVVASESGLGGAFTQEDVIAPSSMFKGFQALGCRVFPLGQRMPSFLSLV